MSDQAKAAMFSAEDQTKIQQISEKEHMRLVEIVAGVGEPKANDKAEEKSVDIMDVMKENAKFGKLAYRELLLLKIFKLKDRSVSELNWLAKEASERLERFEDMCIFIKYLIMKRLEDLKKEPKDREYKGEQGPLMLAERNNFSVAYKNVVGVRRGSWRILNDKENTARIFKDMPEDQRKKSVKKVKEFNATIAEEIKTVCEEIQWLLKQLADATEKLKKEGTLEDKNDSHIFYLKMVGDYFRYLREAFEDEEKYKDLCNDAYKKAMEMAEKTLKPTDPTRLGLALNYSVCHFEILNDKEAACKLAKDAFDKAIEKLDSLNDSSYKDSTLIMQLLRDNLTIWSSTGDENEGNF